MKKIWENILLIVINIIVLILQILPYSAVYYSSFINENGQREYITKLYSSFDFLIFGNGNFGPFLTSLGVIISLLLLIINFFTNKGEKFLKFSISISFILSLFPLILGINFYNIYSLMITILILLQLIILLFIKDKTHQNN